MITLRGKKLYEGKVVRAEITGSGGTTAKWGRWGGYGIKVDGIVRHPSENGFCYFRDAVSCARRFIAEKGSTT